jgi:hypothetical protein
VVFFAPSVLAFATLRETSVFLAKALRGRRKAQRVEKDPQSPAMTNEKWKMENGK